MATAANPNPPATQPGGAPKAGQPGSGTRPAAPSGATIRVRATRLGFYGDVLRHPGAVFDLYPRKGTFTEPVKDKDGEPKTHKVGNGIEHPVTKETDNKTLSAQDQFSPRWMEKVSAKTPEHAPTEQQAVDAEHDRVLQERIQRGAPVPGAPPMAASGDQLMPDDNAIATGDRDVLDQ